MSTKAALRSCMTGFHDRFGQRRCQQDCGSESGQSNVSMFLPIPAENQPGLIADFEGDPFVGHALSSATWELYHRYAMYLAPLTAALTTIKHCEFGHRCPAVINDGNQADGGEPAGSSGRAVHSGAGTC